MLPFPVTLSGDENAHQMYTDCVISDAKSKSTGDLKSLTLIRVVETWRQFLLDLEKGSDGSEAYARFSM